MLLFNSTNLFNLLKPINDPNSITSYDVFIGGTTQAVDYFKGAIIIYPLHSKPLTSSNVVWDYKVNKLKRWSNVECVYQLDFFKTNSPNINYLEVEVEASKIREWLNSDETFRYLRNLSSGITPNYSTIQYALNIEVLKQMVNRATFTFTIYTKEVIYENSEYVTNGEVDQNLILRR